MKEKIERIELIIRTLKNEIQTLEIMEDLWEGHEDMMSGPGFQKDQKKEIEKAKNRLKEVVSTL